VGASVIGLPSGAALPVRPDRDDAVLPLDVEIRRDSELSPAEALAKSPKPLVSVG